MLAKCWRSVGEVMEKCWRPPGRSVVREDTVSESEFLGRAWSAWGSCGCDVKHYHCQTPQLLTVSQTNPRLPSPLRHCHLWEPAFIVRTTLAGTPASGNGPSLNIFLEFTKYFYSYLSLNRLAEAESFCLRCRRGDGNRISR